MSLPEGGRQAARLHIGDRVFERLLDQIAASGRGAARFRFFCLASIALVCVVAALIGAAPTFRYGHDDFLFLENGWRVLYGLRPHLDFWSPWGPVSFLLAALGLRLTHGAPSAVGVANAIAAALIALWVYGIGRRRLEAIPASLAALYTALLACTPCPLGEPPWLSSHAMFYNRLGYALLVPLMLECFAWPAPTRAPGRERWWGGFSTGAAAALALFLKASFSLVGLGFVAISLLSLRDRRRIIGLAAGSGAVSLAALAYLRFNAGAVLHALRMAAGARTEGLPPNALPHALTNYPVPFVILLGLALAASRLKPRPEEWLGRFQLPILAVAVHLASIALLSTNQQDGGFPLAAVFAVIVASRLAGAGAPAGSAVMRPDSYRNGATLLACAFLFVPPFAVDAWALTAAAVHKVSPPLPACSAPFTEPRLAGLILCDRPGEVLPESNGLAYTTYVNEGASILRRYGHPTDKVLTMDMQDPFPYALGWPPPRGGTASSAFNVTLSGRYRPAMDEFFGDATVVMVPKHPAELAERLDGFNRIYLPEVPRRFRLVAESDWWRLYRRP
jgi:hypothetical protein